MPMISRSLVSQFAVRQAALAACLIGAASRADAQNVYINEIMFNAPNPSDTDASHQYVELRGLPNQSLANYFLIFIENEDGADHIGNAGVIENIFDLNGASLGANGFLVLRQKVDPTPNYADYRVHPAATDRRNTGAGQGFGDGPTSSIGAETLNIMDQSGVLEASGFTAMLIRTDGLEANRPLEGSDIDENNDGMDHPNGHDGWTIVDSIGIFAEEHEAEFGRVYAPLAFGFEPTATGLPPGGVYVPLPWPELEAEYIGRWGNSTGRAPGDWHASNVTTNSQSGFQNMGDFRQSAQPHGSTNRANWESSQGVPYGTIITNTVGSPNYPLNVGDFDADGLVEIEDFAQWPPLYAEGGLDGRALLAWQRNQGLQTRVGLPAQVIPEPAAAIGAVAWLSVFAAARRRQRAGSNRPPSNS